MKTERENERSASRQRMADRWSTAYRASREITASLDIEQVFKTIHRAVRGVMPCRDFAIILYDESLHALEARYLIENGRRIKPMSYSADLGLGGHILRTGKPLLLNDLEAIRASGIVFVTLGEEDNTRALLAVPLQVQERTIGMLSAQSNKPGVYTFEDQEMLEILASPAAAAIENARLYERSRRELAERNRMEADLRRSQEETTHVYRQMMALAQAAEAVGHARTNAQVFQTLQDQLDPLGMKATVFELDESGKNLRISFLFFKGSLVRRAEALTGLSLQNFRFRPRPASLYDRVLRQGETIHVTDPARAVADTLPTRLCRLARPLAQMFSIRQTCFAPLSIEGRVMGILAVTAPDLSEADIPAVTTFANQTAIAMENARLHEQARQEIDLRRALEEESRQRNQELLFINALNTAINQGESLARLTTIIAREARKIFHTNGATLHLIDATRGKLVMQNLALQPALVKKIEKLIGRSIPRIEHDLGSDHPYRQVLESHQTMIINDTARIVDFTTGFLGATRFPPRIRSQLRKAIPAIVRLLGYRSLLVVPLVSEGGVIGTLDMGREQPFTREDADRLCLIAGQLTAAIVRKQAEEDLRASEEKLRSIFRVAPAGIGAVKDGVLMEVNARICEMTGYSQEELIGQDSRMLYPTQEEFETVGTEKYRQISRQGHGMIETRWQRKDGVILDILLASTPVDMADLSKGVIFTALDITSRKEAEKALREAHDRLLLVMESIPADIYVADMDTYEILFMNQHMRTSFGEALVGKTCHRVFRNEANPCAFCSNSSLLDEQGNPTSGVTWEGQNPVTGQWYRNYDRAIRWVDGRWVRLESAVDIGDSKRAEEMLRQRAEELAALQATVLEITTQHDPGSLLQAIVERAVRLLHGEGGGLYLCDPQRQEVRCAISYKTPEDYTGVVLKYGEGAAGTVAQTGEPLIIRDYRAWEGRASRFEQGQPFRALVSAPMVWQGQVTGVIHVLSAQNGQEFTREDLELLTLFANHAAIAFENARLLQESRQRLRESEALRQASQALTASLELQPLLENILAAACQAIPAAEKGSIVLQDSDGILRIHALTGYANRELLRLAFRPGEGFVSHVFEQQQPMCLKEIRSDYQIPFRAQYDEVSAVQSAISAPLTVKGERIGVISLDNASHPAAFHEDDLNLLVSFAASAAVAIQNARLYEQTRHRESLLTVMHKVSQKTSHLLDLESMGGVIIPTIEAQMGWSRGSLWLVSGEGHLRLLYHSTPGFEGEARRKEQERLGRLIARPGQGIIGWVIQHGTTVRSGNVLADDRYIAGSTDIRSELCVPLMSGERIIGCLNFESPQENAFNEEDERVLTTLAAEISGAVERIRLFDQIRQRADELGALAQVSGALRMATNRSEMIRVILDQLTDLLKLDDSALLLFDQSSRENVLEMGRGNWAEASGTRILAGDALSLLVNPAELPLVSENILEDERFASLPLFRASEAVAGFPLLVQEHYIGSLWVGRRRKTNQSTPQSFSQEELRLLGSVADIAANAMHRASLHEQTLRNAEQMVAVNEIGHMLTETLDLDQVQLRLSHAIKKLLPGLEFIAISLYDPRTTLFTCTSAMLADEFLDAASLPVKPLDPQAKDNQSKAILSGDPVTASEAVGEPWHKPAQQARRPVAALYLPMHSKEVPIGIIHVQKATPEAFKPEEINMLSLIANTAAITIENARLFAETSQRLRYLTALHNIDAAISASVDLRVTFGIILENITKELNVDAAALALLNSHTRVLEFTASRGFQTRLIEGMRIRLGEGLAGQAASQRRGLSLLESGQRDLDLFPEENFVTQYALPLIAKGQVQGVLQVFHRSSLVLDPDWSNFLNALAQQAAIAMDNANLFDSLQRTNLELTLAYDATIQGWSQAMELRDKETQGHAERVVELAMLLARKLEISDAEAVHLRRGVLLHDIGKMGVPDSILLKPGPLTPEEWEIMRRHPVLAFEMLSGISYLRPALDVPYCHHERWDGSGYPRGLQGEQIPLSARLFAVVDAFDALTSDRPYRAAWSREEARRYIQEQSGRQFDPAVVEAFLTLKI